MATQKELQKALQHPYDRMLFVKGVLHPVFGASLKLLDKPQKPSIDLVKTETAVIDQVLIYGSIDLEDGADVTCYEIVLKPSVRIEQSRVAIQHYVRKLLISGQAALVNFVAPDNKDMWRFTLVAKDSKLTGKGITETQTHPKRYTYLVEKDRPNRTMAERLETLSLAETVTLESLIAAFSVEAMTKAFFDEYKEHYQNFVQYLTGKRLTKQSGKWVEKKIGRAHPFLASMFNGDEKAARDFIKKLLGRIVFLYFVQKKRWLGATTTKYTDGSQDFLFNLFQQTGGDERFFPVGLSELFFNALNTKRKGDDWKLPTGQVVRVPYLNGGLFERDEIDDKIHKKGDLLTFPPRLFSHVDKMDTPNARGFLDFLNAYNFTVYEDSEDDHTVAVDPEMLGHIFENLLEDNKDKGAFYTPKEIVRYMCQESLYEYLKTYLQSNKHWPSKEEKGKELEGHLHEFVTKKIAGNVIELDKPLAKALRDVKICDPAIGSGAFPMGLLSEIFHCVQALYEPSFDNVGAIWGIDEWKPHEVKKHIIQNSIYGVDIEKGAVDIARLRFWLSLIVDEPVPTALPNLDYKIVVGNSLVSKLGDEIVDIDWKADETSHGLFGADLLGKKKKILEKISLEQREIFNPESDKKKLAADVRNLKIELLINQLELMIKLANQDSPPKKDSFTDNKKFLKATENYHRVLGWKDRLKRLKELKSEPDEKLGYFDWKLDFPEVMNPQLVDRPGFDIVIGNPPYVSHDKIGDKDFLRTKYDVFEPFADLYAYFVELGVGILRRNGYLSFITSNSFLRAEYGRPLRKYFKKLGSVSSIINLENTQLFQDAIVNTCIIGFVNGSYDKRARVVNSNYASEDDFADFVRKKTYVYDQASFNEESWSLLEPRVLDVWRRMKMGNRTLTDYGAQINLGIATGANDVFILGRNEYAKLIAANKKNANILKPILRGRDIHRYYYVVPDLKIILSKNGIDVRKDYPDIFEYLKKQGSDFRNRGAQGEHWTNLRACSFFDDFKKEKIVWIELADNNRFALCPEEIYLLNSAYFLIPPKQFLPKYLLGILNSRAIKFFLKTIANTSGMGTARWINAYVKEFPIPLVSLKSQERLGKIVAKIIELKESDLDSDVSLLERGCDLIVFKLYNLSIDDIRFVDPDFSIKEEEYDLVEI